MALWQNNASTLIMLALINRLNYDYDSYFLLLLLIINLLCVLIALYGHAGLSYEE